MLKIYEAYAPRANPPDANYPLGSVKNVTVPGAKDGTPLDSKWGNNIEGFHQALLAEAGIVASGQSDKVGSSQLLDALKTLTKIVVPDFEKLRKTAPSATMLSVHLDCHTNKESGGGGEFYWDSSSVDPDNGGTVAAVENIVTGRWKRSPIMVGVTMFGAVGDAKYSLVTGQFTGTDSAPAFKKLAKLCDEGAAYWHLDSFDKDYLIGSTIVFKQPGVKLTSNNGARALTREDPRKKGNIFVQNGVTTAFDFGGYRTTGNPADNWTIDGISLFGYANASCDGFVFTTATNGPDRGIVLFNCSGTYLKKAVSLPSRGTQTAAATVEVKNCTFIGNDYAIAAEYGNVLGIRIVSNQLEQNTKGGIKGSFNGPVYIADNMLEGQPNAIYLEYPEVILGNLCDAVIERNYFESNTGQYSIKMNAGSRCSLTVRNNYWAPSFPTDKIVIAGFATMRLNIDEELYQDVAVTFNEYGGVINYGSTFLNNKVSAFLIRKLVAGKSPLVITADYENFISSSAINSKETGLTHYDTPYGNMLCANWGEFVFIPAEVLSGQMFALNIFCRIDDGANISFEVLNNARSSSLLKFEAYDAQSIDCNGRWALVTVPILANQATNGMWFKSTAKAGSTGEFLVAGIASKNYGTFVNDAASVIAITPAMPSRVVNQLGSNYSQTSTSGNTSIVDTGIKAKNIFGEVSTFSVYDVFVTGSVNSSSTTESASVFGNISIISDGSAWRVVYIQQGSQSVTSPLTISTVFWDGLTESASTGSNTAELRIKIAGYLNNTGYNQVCRLVKRA